VTESRDDDVPCAENYQWCKAICCSLQVKLAPGDDPGLARDPMRPDLLAQEHGVCVHNEDGECTAYEYRPQVCRKYDCRDDTRIWRDYDKRIVNPNLDKLKLAAMNHRKLPVVR
jgi:hypothetical protein